jgi:hypothetical protein
MVVLFELALVLGSVLFLFTAGRTGEPLPSNPHNQLNDPVSCLECHDSYRDEVDGHEFVVQITQACERCHDLRKIERSHPVDVDPRRAHLEVIVPDELPLDHGLVTCGSCHDPHLTYLATVRSFREQEPKAVVEVEYFQTFYTRMNDPVEGFDPLCDSCHHLL